jgi:hypothetical protein
MKAMGDHRVGTREEYRAARDELLAREKELVQPRLRRHAHRRPAEPFLESGNLGPVPGLAAQCGTDPAGYLTEGPSTSRRSTQISLH